MKRRFTIISLAAVLVFSLSLSPVLGCTTIAVGKDLTDTGSVLFCHSEELDQTPHRLISVPRKEHKEGELFDVLSGGVKVPQPKTTYAYIGAAVPDKEWYPGDFSSGVNEYQVTIANNMSWTKEVPTYEEGYDWELVKGGIIWTEFTQLVLERAKTAREGIDIIGSFHEKYKLSGDPGTMYMVADPNEAWYIEMAIDGQWVAKRVEDDGFYVLTNAFTIDKVDKNDPNTLCSKDVISYAEKKGWYDKEKDGEFSFKDVYGEKENQEWPGNWLRIEMADKMLEKPDKVTKENLMEIMRTAYEGTDKYDPDPKTGSVLDRDDTRSISTIDTDESAVVEFRQDLPKEVGTTIWWTLATSKTSPYIPYYLGATEFPKEYADTAIEKDDGSAYWVNRNLTTLVHKNYSQVFDKVKKTWDKFEQETFDLQPEKEAKALELIKADKTDEGNAYLNDFSNERANKAYEEAVNLTDTIKDTVAKDKQRKKMTKIILIAAGALVVLAAVVIVVRASKKRKGNKAEQ